MSKGGDELSSVYARFIKDRAEVERDYAKNIRKLVNKYSEKTSEANKKVKETSQAKGFRWVPLNEDIINLELIKIQLKEMAHVMLLNMRIISFVFASPNKEWSFIKHNITLVCIHGLGFNIFNNQAD